MPLLEKHTIVLAGAGSGKTVLLNRIIEEASLAGVSSIVIDSTNDLAALSDHWTEPPSGWGPDDAAKFDSAILFGEAKRLKPGPRISVISLIGLPSAEAVIIRPITSAEIVIVQKSFNASLASRQRFLNLGLHSKTLRA